MSAILSIISVLVLVRAFAEDPLVEIPYGKIRGLNYTSPEGFEAQLFKHIPYASAPVGDLRWKKPQKPKKWTEERDARRFGPACVQGFLDQHPAAGYSEDCLHVNVYTSTKCRETLCPVVYYIHGGNIVFDSPVLFEDEHLVKNFVSHDVVLVTASYRLGVYGTLYLGDEEVLPANLAVHDAIAGFHVTREIVATFGGDTDRITIMGHSSGAEIVLHMAFSPAISPPDTPTLFQSAVIMSGMASILHPEEQISVTREFLSVLDCDGSPAQVMDCMMNKSTLELMVAQHYGGKHLGGFTLAGELFPMKSMRKLFENPAKFRLMTGTTAQEMDMKSSEKPNELEREGFDNANECLEKYQKDKKRRRKVFEHTLGSDLIFLDTWRIANAQAMKGGETFLYEYDHPKHAYHVADLSYIMGIHSFKRDANEEWLAHVYPLYFINFIKGMAPAENWQPVQSELMNYYSINKGIGVKPEMKHDYHREVITYWNGEMRSYDDTLSVMKLQARRPSKGMNHSVFGLSYRNDVGSYDNARAFSNSFLLSSFLVLLIIVLFVFVMRRGNRGVLRENEPLL